MRIAIIADIHGNLAALEAALARIEGLRVDRIVVAGDIVVGAPDSLACWHRVKALNCPVLRGNHERYVFDLNTPRARSEWSSPRFGPVQYAAEQLGKVVLDELAALPAVLRFPDVPDVLFVHGSARNDTDLVFPYTRDAELVPMFEGTSERWLLRGHNHYAGLRLWGERRIVTVGSVGLPLDGRPSAQFSVIERIKEDWVLQQYAASYDVGQTVRRFRESDYLERAGPMAQLYFREVITASFHIIPFLKLQSERERRGEPLPLEQAVRQFLGSDY